MGLMANYELRGAGLGALALALLTSWTFFVIYRIYFHPLAKFPGPKLNAVTRIPLALTMFRGRVVYYAKELHEKYGDVVRISPNELSYINDAAWQDIYGHRTGGKKQSFEKDATFLGPDLVGSNGIIRSRGDANHAHIRKLFSFGFSDRALKDQEVILKTYVDWMIRRIKTILEEDPNSKVAISDIYNFTTFDIIADLTFGEPLNLLRDNAYSPWVASIFANVQQTVFGQIMRWYPIVRKLPVMKVSEDTKAKSKSHRQNSADKVNRRLERKTERPDFWTYILKYKGDEGLTLGTMHSTASTLMVAGSETTATLCSGLTYLLLKNPAQFGKLRDEIHDKFKSEEEITISGLAGCVYLNACLQEALRLYPPAPTGMPRVVPANGAPICGEHIPANTVVYVSQYAAYRSEANFHDPESFRPERWLPSTSQQEPWASDNKAVHQPFSFGPRNCLGKNLAYHEMRLIMAKLIYNFDLDGLAPECEDWMEMEKQKVFVLWEKPKLMVHLTSREAASVAA